LQGNFNETNLQEFHFDIFILSGESKKNICQKLPVSEMEMGLMTEGVCLLMAPPQDEWITKPTNGRQAMDSAALTKKDFLSGRHPQYLYLTNHSFYLTLVSINTF